MSASASSGTPGWDPPQPEELLHSLPGYEIIGLLGRGGMGAVFRGRQTSLDRDVAIKVLPDSFAGGADEQDFAARFLREARSMAKLNHPAIISVHDFGTTPEGRLYFVMEFVEGMDIHQYLARCGGRLPPDDAVTITCHVLDALAYAHGHGIIHRDIKPANVLLDHEGRVKIADFGLAKKLATEDDNSGPGMTVNTVAMGTRDFLAPEALDPGQSPDHRADLYAVGVMLYQMLTGRMPRGSFDMPSKLVDGLDPRIDRIVIKAMQPDPDQRYSGALEIRADLDSVISRAIPRGQGKPVASKGARAGGWAIHRIMGLAGVAAFLGVLAFMIARPGKNEAEKPSAMEPEPVAGIGGTVPAVAELEARPSPAPPAADPLPATEDSPADVASEDPAPRPDAGGPSESLAAAAPEPPPEIPPPPQTPPVSPLANLPGLGIRLENYLAARNARLAALADKYLRGLDAGIDDAAKAADLKLANALNDEKERVRAMRRGLDAPAADMMKAVAEAPALPDLPGDSSSVLTGLRRTWQNESVKIRGNLDSALAKSLDVLSAELTKARDFEAANALHEWRGTLALTEGTGGAADTSPAPEAPDHKRELAAARKDRPFVNGLGMAFVPVPGTGTLFCIHETRWKDYAAYAAANPGISTNWQNQTHDGHVITENAPEHPVVEVSWEEAKAFCKWLSDREGLVFRLPTDREWSAAVGLGRMEKWGADDTPRTVFKVTGEYPWGGRWPPPKGAGNYSDRSRKAKAPTPDAAYLENYDDGYPTTAPVMSYEPNKLGIHDLGGNVWEWCEDWWEPEQQTRVMRGASWDRNQSGVMWSSCRVSFSPAVRHNNFGFRVVVETGEK